MHKLHGSWLGLFLLLSAGPVVAGVLAPGLARQLQSLDPAEAIQVLVVLADQADVKALDRQLGASQAGLTRRHQVVVGALQDAARRSQPALLSHLATKTGGAGILGYTPHWLINSVVVTGTAGAIADLAGRPEVAVIEPALPVQLIEPAAAEVGPGPERRIGIGLTPGLAAIGADRVWHELGFRGEGAIVGILDTGVDGNHPALHARWRGNIAPASECWLDAADLGHPSFPQDLHFHGTHVMGTLCGLAPNDTIGVAPGAVWIASNCLNAAAGLPFDSAVLASLEFMTDPDGDPVTTAEVPDVVQNSWGVNENSGHDYIDCDSRWWDAIDNCEAAGVVLIWAAGNDGPSPGSLRSPADRASSATNCYSVGSVDAADHEFPYPLSDFSSRGPSGCGGEFAVKPELVAPGGDVYSAEPGGGYRYLSGTSVAGPHVAGVVALMRSANPDLDVETIKRILSESSRDLGPAGEDNGFGHGFLDAYAAVLAVAGGTVSGTVIGADSGEPIPGATVRQIDGPMTVLTDPAGFYEMVLTSGQHTLEISAFGFYPETRQVEVPLQGDLQVDVSLAAAPPFRVYGFVFDPQGNKLAAATVSAVGSPAEPVSTDSNGYFEIHLPAGASYPLRAQAPGFGPDQESVQVETETRVNFFLTRFGVEDFETGDFLLLPWDTGGHQGWAVTDDSVGSGQFAARAGAVQNNQESFLSVSLTVGWGAVSFAYRVSSEEEGDRLEFFIDGVPAGAWSGDVGWSQASFEVVPGRHTFTWKYLKDGQGVQYADSAWIDDISFPGLVGPFFPALSLDFSTLAHTVLPGATSGFGKMLRNEGEADLHWQIEFLPPPAAGSRPDGLEPAPVRKGETDPRHGSTPARGQGGPDGYGYSWIDSDEPGGPVYDWVEINGVGTVAGSGDDLLHGPFDLGFSFPFYGNEFDQVKICTNGYLTFTSDTAEWSNWPIPSTGQPNDLAAPLWDDLNPTTGGTIYFYRDNVQQQFVVEWDGVNHFPDEDPETFQVILRPDGSLRYQYRFVSRGGGCTAGIENQTGTEGLQVVFNAPYLHSGLAVLLKAESPVPWLAAVPDRGTVAPGAGQIIRITFAATDLAEGDYEAVMVISTDDPQQARVVIPVTLTVSLQVAGLEGDDPAAAFSLLPARPNPFNPRTEIRFNLPEAGVATLELFDLVGRLVKTVVTGALPAGSHSAVWDGCDADGRPVASGTYYARLTAFGQLRVEKLVLVR